MARVTQFDRFRIQMQVLIPLVRALREEFGHEPADAVVTRVLDEIARSQGERAAAAGISADGIAAAVESFAADEALGYEVVEADEDSYGFDVRRCRYMEYMEQAGARDLGPMLVCRADIPMAEGMGVGFERSQTIMEGGNCCDFRYRLKQAAS